MRLDEYLLILSKPETYVSTMVQDSVTMTFAGEIQPCVFCELMSIGALNDRTNQQLTEAICGCVESTLAIPGNRTYIRFSDVAAQNWGHDGHTIG